MKEPCLRGEGDGWGAIVVIFIFLLIRVKGSCLLISFLKLA